MGLVHEMKETGRRLRELIPQKQLLPLQKCSDEARILGILLNNSKEGQVSWDLVRAYILSRLHITASLTTSRNSLFIQRAPVR